MICETWPTSQINGKTEYPWREGNALYLVGSEGFAVLWAAKTAWNHQWRTLSNTINPIEESNSRKTPGICDQTRGNNYPSWQRSALCCYSGYLFGKQWMESFTPPFWLLTTICSGRCRMPSLEYVSHQNRVSKLAWFILGRQASAVHSFRWVILWIILLYMFFLNKRSNFEKKPHELSYRSNNFFHLSGNCRIPSRKNDASFEAINESIHFLTSSWERKCWWARPCAIDRNKW